MTAASITARRETVGVKMCSRSRPSGRLAQTLTGRRARQPPRWELSQGGLRTVPTQVVTLAECFQ